MQNIETWTFDNDELFNLVVTNRKHGTCCLYDNKSDLSKIGDINIIYDSMGNKVKIKITNVKTCRFCDVDKIWAKIEGEGDLSLEYWQKTHQDFFTKEKPDFQPTDMLELNEFIVLN